MFLHKNPRNGGINFCLTNNFTKNLNTEEGGNQDTGASGVTGSTTNEPSTSDKSTADEPSIGDGSTAEKAITAAGPSGVG